jgi:hypothetical protein
MRVDRSDDTLGGRRTIVALTDEEKEYLEHLLGDAVSLRGDAINQGMDDEHFEEAYKFGMSLLYSLYTLDTLRMRRSARPLEHVPRDLLMHIAHDSPGGESKDAARREFLLRREEGAL